MGTEKKPSKSLGYVILIGVLLLLALSLAGCDRFEERDFRVVVNNINSPDPVTAYAAGQELGSVVLGVPQSFTISLPVPNTVGTGPEETRQCFPVSGSVLKKNLSSRSNPVCSRENQIVTVDFEIDRGVLDIRTRVQ